MPLPFLAHILENGPPEFFIEHWKPIAKTAIAITAIVLLKLYTLGASNPVSVHGGKLHGKVVILTGGTSGIGAAVAEDLATRGAQLVLLTQTSPGDPFVAEFVQDLRTRTANNLIYAEQVDLSSLHSVRKFATKWIDNAPPRRLDMVILCASTLAPPGSKRRETHEGVEETWAINFLANFHLLGILSPAIRAQPFDRDVRIIIATCSSYISSPSLNDGSSPISKNDWSPSKAYARSKLALMIFGRAFQKHIDAYKRPDQLPPNARVVLVDPGLTRTPGMRRWLTRGTLWGLALYISAYAVPWMLLKSPGRGAQSVIYAAMEPVLRRVPGGRIIKECREVDPSRLDIDDEETAKKLWEGSDKLVETVEREQAKKRAQEKKRNEEAKKNHEDKEKVQEIESLVNAIKKGKQSQPQGQTQAQGRNVKAKKNQSR